MYVQYTKHFCHINLRLTYKEIRLNKNAKINHTIPFIFILYIQHKCRTKINETIFPLVLSCRYRNLPDANNVV